MVTGTTDRELSFGEKAVRYNFNPDSDPRVSQLKALSAQIIDILNNIRGTERNEQARLCSIAITEVQGASHWAMDAATYQE